MTHVHHHRGVAPGLGGSLRSFLFPQPRVLCLSLQDLLRRDMLYYKGRLEMDQMEVIDLEDGREKDFNISVKNALKLRSLNTEEIHILCTKKPEQKARWLRAFADERRQVLHDRETGKAREVAGSYICLIPKH